jgi:hypothetical protein
MPRTPRPPYVSLGHDVRPSLWESVGQSVEGYLSPHRGRSDGAQPTPVLAAQGLYERGPEGAVRRAVGADPGFFDRTTEY